MKIRIMKHWLLKENIYTSFLDSPHIFFTTKKNFAKLRQFARFTFGSLLDARLRIRQAPWSFPMQFFHGEGHRSTCGSSAIQARQRKCQSIQPCPQPCASKNASQVTCGHHFLRQKKVWKLHESLWLDKRSLFVGTADTEGNNLSGFMSFHVFLSFWGADQLPFFIFPSSSSWSNTSETKQMNGRNCEFLCQEMPLSREPHSNYIQLPGCVSYSNCPIYSNSHWQLQLSNHGWSYLWVAPNCTRDDFASVLLATSNQLMTTKVQVYDSSLWYGPL